MQRRQNRAGTPATAFASNTFRRTGRALLLAAIATAPLYATHAVAQTAAAPVQSGPRHYDIPAGPVEQALSAFARSAGVIVVFTPDLVQGHSSPGLRGEANIEEALTRLLQGSGLQAVRAEDGSFTLRRVPEGTAVLKAVKVQAAGLGSTTEGTGSYSTPSMNSATKLDLSIRETPQSVSVITRQQIEDQGLTTVAQALGRTVGISLGQSEPDRANSTARGFDISDYRIDDMPTIAVGMHNEQMLADTAIYDRVEIVRGATGLLTGNGDPGASINMIRKRPTREFQGYVSGGIGRWDAYRIEADVSGPLISDGNIRGRLVGVWKDADSHVAEYNNQRQLVYGILEADVASNTVLTAGGSWRRSDSQGMTYGQPVPLFYADGSRTDFPRSTTTGNDWTYLDSETSNVFVGLEHRFAEDWRANLRYERQELDSANRMAYLYGFPDRATGTGVDTYFNSYDANGTQDSADLYVAGGFDLFGRQHEAVLGWSYSDASNEQDYHPLLNSEPLSSFYEWRGYSQPNFSSAYGNELADGLRQDGYYAVTRWQIAEPLKVIVGARLSNVRYDGSSYYWQSDETSLTGSKYDNELTPYGGIVYDLSENYSAYASYTEIFKFQTSKDRTGGLLDPVNGTNYEAGVKGKFNEGRLFVSAAIFKIKQDNLAEFDITVDGEDRYREVDGTTVEGYELEISGEPLPHWNLSGGFTRRLARSADGQSVMTQEPDNLLRLTGSHHLQGALDGLMLGAHVTWQSAIRVPATGPNGEDAVQKTYALLHLFGSYRIDEHLQIQANLNNLFDKTYYEGGLYSYGYYGEPRNLTVSAKYAF